MDQQNTIRNSTLLLSIIAGFCDTLTFVTSNEFSAHVTGNFIVFAYDIIKRADSESWMKLLSFPVFVAAIIVGGWVIIKLSQKYSILIFEGSILMVSGTIMLVIRYLNIDSIWLTHTVILLIVFAMGLQNAFGKRFSKNSYGPTTMMTGNVTQASLDLWEIVKDKFKNDVALKSLKNLSYTIGGFLIGCLIGAVAGEFIGLSAAILPGIVLLVYPKKADITD
jgi:uncharacterized membrane protein YoaK (UPF0700 family)